MPVRLIDSLQPFLGFNAATIDVGVELFDQLLVSVLDLLQVRV